MKIFTTAPFFPIFWKSVCHHFYLNQYLVFTLWWHKYYLQPCRTMYHISFPFCHNFLSSLETTIIRFIRFLSFLWTPHALTATALDRAVTPISICSNTSEIGSSTPWSPWTCGPGGSLGFILDWLWILLITVTLGISFASPLSSSHCFPVLFLSWLPFLGIRNGHKFF